LIQGTKEKNHYLLGWIEYEIKNVVVSHTTQYHHVEIYDILNPRFVHLETYQKSLETAGDLYESQHPEFFHPDRYLYVDNVFHTRLFNEAAYHEALVHPAMITHAKPRRVAIIGGATGATLREVLKHVAVEQVLVLEPDVELIRLAREHLPSWSDCRNIVSSTEPLSYTSCWDDPRVQVRHEDPVAWFLQWYSSEAEETGTAETFDVIILDSL